MDPRVLMAAIHIVPLGAKAKTYRNENSPSKSKKSADNEKVIPRIIHKLIIEPLVQVHAKISPRKVRQSMDLVIPFLFPFILTLV